MGGAGLGRSAGQSQGPHRSLSMTGSSLASEPGRLLLVDNQLPAGQARHLAAIGYPSLHVRDIGLADADDRTIWAHAGERGWVIVTKDEDFQDLSIRFGLPPQVVWVRLSNCRKPSLFEVFDRQTESIKAAMEAGESIVELRG